VDVKVDVVEAVTEVGITNTVSVFVVWLTVAYLTNVDIVVKAVPPLDKVYPAVVKLTTGASPSVVDVDHITLRVVVDARSDVVGAVLVEVVAEVIVLTVTGFSAEVGSRLPILLFDHSVNQTVLPVTVLVAKHSGLLPLTGSAYSVT
jgi:hypothetical protein